MTRGLLDGFPLLGSAAESWALRAGVQPVEMGFELAPFHVSELFKREQGSPGRAVTLETPSGTYENLVLRWEDPAENMHLGRIVCCDRRAFWPRKHVYRMINIRRNVGTKRLTNASPLPELQAVVERARFAKWSLAPGIVPWNVARMLPDVFQEVFLGEFRHRGLRPDLIIEPEIATTLLSLPVDGLRIDDPGDSAIQRLLAVLPEANVYVDRRGRVIVYSMITGRERDLVTASPEKVGRGHIIFSSRRFWAPKYIDVLFTREHEIRFDFIESATVRTAAQEFPTDSSIDPNSPPNNLGSRSMENVLPVPDFSLVVDGETVVQGTWITIEQAIRAWSLPAGVPGTQLTFDQLRRAFLPHTDLWASLLQAGRQAPEVDWPARIAALQQHYRRTFRLPRDWWDSIRSARANRISIVETVRGQRAPALVFADHAYVGTERSFLRKRGDNPGGPPGPDGAGGQLNEWAYYTNVRGYPGEGKWDATTRPMPAELVIIDEDQGIVQIHPKLDPWRTYEEILPGIVVNGPNGDPTDTKAPIAWNAANIESAAAEIQLQADYKVAIILSVVPGAPNNTVGLYAVRVTLEDVRSLLPKMVVPGLGAPMEVRVGPQIEPARIAWADGQAAVIKQAFEGSADATAVLRGTGLVLNDQPQDKIGISGASLQSIARAYAASIFAQWADRFVGAAQFHPIQLVPTGRVDAVTDTIAPNGEPSTGIALPEALPSFDPFAYMSSDTRAIIMKLVQERSA